MQSLYVIGQTKPLTQANIKEIENSIEFPLPQDYKNFLTQYGYGDINGLIIITSPDDKYIKKRYSHYVDIWDWKRDDKQKVLNGLTIAKTIDADTVVVIDDNTNPIIILPRGSTELMHFSTFQALVDYYDTTYEFNYDLYFDTDYNSQTKYIDISNDDQNGQIIKKMHKDFLETYAVDRSFNVTQQPRYIIQAMGGWVYFDLIYFSTIRVKYQEQFKAKAIEVVNFITECLTKYSSTI